MSIDDFQVRESFREFLPTAPQAMGNSTWVNEILGMVDWDLWIYGVGPDPTMTLNFVTPNNTQAIDLANAYIANPGVNPSNYMDYMYWTSPSQSLFQDTLLNQVPSGMMTHAIMAQIDMNYDVTATTNPEIKQRWYTMGILLNYSNVTAPAETWIATQGRLKYLEPIYEALMMNGNTTTANEWYASYGHNYARVAQALVEDIIAVPAGVPSAAKKNKVPRHYRL